MSWYSPAVQLLQCSLPAKLEYRPCVQFSHSSVGPLDRRPATQAVHLLPPADVSVSVTEPTGHDSHAADATLLKRPGSQSAQSSTGDAEYLPDAHTVHVVAPAKGPVSVIEPAKHG